jgi:hypothetical protein
MCRELESSTSSTARLRLPAVKKNAFFSPVGLLNRLTSLRRFVGSDAPFACLPHTQRRDTTRPSATESDDIEAYGPVPN